MNRVMVCSHKVKIRYGLYVSPFRTDSFMEASLVMVAAAELIVFGCSAILAYFGFSASRRTGSRSLLMLSAGLGFVMVGTFVALILQVSGTVEFPVCIGIERSITSVGFLLVTYALFVSEPDGGIAP